MWENENKFENCELINPDLLKAYIKKKIFLLYASFVALDARGAFLY